VINITLQFETLAEASAALERMNGSTAAKAEAVAVIEKAAKAPKPVATPPVAEVATTVPAEPAAASPSEAITYDQVAAIIVAYMKAQGKPAALAILDTFGLKSFTAAKPEQFADIKAAFEAVAV